MRKIPSDTKANGRSLKTVRSGETLLRLAIGLRGSRLRTRRFAVVRINRRMNPRIRVAHAKPTVGKSFWSMRGKIIPPIEPEVIAIPVALPRFTRKKWPTEATQGVTMRQPPIPLRTL
jgi:hypothetical protein